METGVACQTEKAELCDAETQTEVTELTVIQRKEFLELKKENMCLKEKLEKKASTDIFSEEFLMSMVLMFLMKLCLNLFDEDLAQRFGIHSSTVSRNFHRVLDVAFEATSFLIQLLERDVLKLTMPLSFRFFKTCCVIIDCTEIFIEQPSDLLARAQV